MTPRYSVPDERLKYPGFYALDTETTLFRPTTYGWNGKTRIAPFGGHTLVLGSLAGEGQLEVYHRADLLERVRDLLLRGCHIVFHNCAFDIPVLQAADPTLRPLFCAAVNEGRIHDTGILEVLIQIAVGSRAMSQKMLVARPTLKSLAARRAGMQLDKEGGTRLTFERYVDPRVPIPETSLKYAADDALATYLVYRSQWREGQILAQPSICKFPVYEKATEKYGLLSETIQIKGALSFAWLEQFPLRVDTQKAQKTRDLLEVECQRLESALVLYHWAKRGKKTQKFHLKLKVIREVLAEYAREHQLMPEMTPSGLITIEHDYWGQNLPRIDKELYAHPETAQTVTDKLSVWLRYTRARKLLSTYIYVYASSERHYPEYVNFGARTGRTAARKPNVQNIPKRHDGIRAFFIPEDGYLFLEGDYAAAELGALAQVYRAMYGGSVLGSAINAGQDPHIAQALRILPQTDPFHALPLEDQKKHPMRQAMKAVNFGLPGGLGWATFKKYAGKAWGVKLSDDEARDLRTKALSADPQLRLYLDDQQNLESRLRIVAHNLCMSFESLIELFKGWNPRRPGIADLNRVRNNLYNWINDLETFEVYPPPGVSKKYDLYRQTTRTLTGRVRDRATFTEAHNTPFQGLVADAGKCALWELYQAHCADSPWQPVAFIHDSVLIQVQKGFESPARVMLNDCMLRAFAHICPDIKMTVDFTKPLERWGKSTNPWGEEINDDVTS